MIINYKCSCGLGLTRDRIKEEASNFAEKGFPVVFEPCKCKIQEALDEIAGYEQEFLSAKECLNVMKKKAGLS